MILPNLFENVCVGQPGFRILWPAEEFSNILFRAAAQDKYHELSPAFFSALEVFFEIYLTVFKRLLVVCSDDSALSERRVTGNTVQDWGSLRGRDKLVRE